jgi:hypothetical protein
LARQRGPGQQGQGGGPPQDLSAALAMARALDQQAAQWANLGRAERDAAADQLLFNRAQQAAQQQADRLTQSTRATTLAYAAASAGLLSWVRAGLAGTVQGEQLAYQQNQLSQQVASIFLPVVQRYTDALTRLVGWFRSLGGEQQAQIMRWSLFTVGLLGSVTVVPRLTAALGTLGMTLKGLALANPVAALTAGVVGLLAQTEGGRESLARLGATLSDAFGKVAGAVGGVATPALQGLADFVASQPGQWAAFGTIAVSVLYRIAAAGKGAAQAFLGWGTALGALVLLAGGLVTALARTRSEALETAAGLEAAVKTGRASPEEARRQARDRAEEAAVRAASETREALRVSGRGLGGQPYTPEELEREAEKTARRVRREILGESEAAIRRGAGRQDVVRSGGAQEDPLQTIRRLEQASVRMGADPNERTARGVETIADMLRRVLEEGVRAARDNRDNPPKND